MKSTPYLSILLQCSLVGTSSALGEKQPPAANILMQSLAESFDRRLQRHGYKRLNQTFRGMNRQRREAGACGAAEGCGYLRNLHRKLSKWNPVRAKWDEPFGSHVPVSSHLNSIIILWEKENGNYSPNFHRLISVHSQPKTTQPSFFFFFPEELRTNHSLLGSEERGNWFN